MEKSLSLLLSSCFILFCSKCSLVDANVYSILSTVSPSTWFFSTPPCSGLTVFPPSGSWATSQTIYPWPWNHIYFLASLLSTQGRWPSALLKLFLVLSFSIITVFQGPHLGSYRVLWSFFILHPPKHLWKFLILLDSAIWSYRTVHTCDLKVRYRYNFGGWYGGSPTYVAPFCSLALLSPEPGGTLILPYCNPYYSALLLVLPDLMSW